MKEEKKAVLIPTALYLQVEERARVTGFGSIDEYIIFILEEVLKEDDEEGHVTFSKEEEMEIKKRLKELGYLD